MSYFPKHYIKTNQSTTGGEFVFRANELDYTGPYWSTGNGRFYTGNTPQSSPIFELLPKIPINNLDFLYSEPVYTDKIKIAYLGDAPIVGDGTLPYNENNVINYSNLRKSPKTANAIKYLPQYNPTLPTQQDYQNSEFIRYFAKKTNENQYIEINQQTYNQLFYNDRAVEWTLYTPFSIFWQLTGDKQQVQQVNKNITEAKIKALKLYSFNEYLKFDFLKYYQFPNISNLYTAGGEFKTANGQNYIGFYHIHDKTGPMIGATHTKEPHGLLFPINETIVSQVINKQTSQVITQTTSSYNPTPMNMGGGYSGGGGSGGGGGGGY